MLDKIENMIKKSEFKLAMQQIHDLDSINELSLLDNIKLHYFTIIILENQKNYLATLKIAKSLGEKLQQIGNSELKLRILKKILEIFWKFNEIELIELLMPQLKALLEELGEEVLQNYNEENAYFMLIKGCIAALNKQLNSAIKNNEKALQFTQNDLMKAKIFHNLGLIHYTKSKINIAINFYKKSQGIYEKHGEILKKSIETNALGILYFYSINMTAKSTPLFLESQKIRERKNIKSLLMIADNNVGELYVLKKQFPEALNTLLRGYAICKELERDPNIFYDELEDYSWFLEPWSLSFVNLFKGVQSQSDYFLYNISSVYYAMGKVQESYKYIKKCLDLEEKLGEDFSTAETLHKIITLTTGSEYFKDTPYYMEKLEKIWLNSSKLYPIINTYYQFSKAIILIRNTEKLDDVVAGNKILYDLSLQKIRSPELSSSIFLFLLKSTICILRLSGDNAFLKIALETVEKLELLAFKLKQPQIIAVSRLIQSKLEALSGHFSKANELNNINLQNCIQTNQWHLACNVFEEHKNLRINKKKIQEMIAHKVSISTRIEFSKIETTLDYFIKYQYISISDSILREFGENYIKIAIFKVDNAGPSVLISEPLGCTQNETLFLQKMAIFHSVAIGQGNNPNFGLFGPFPCPETSDRVSLVYSFNIIDPSLADKRLQGKSYSFISLMMPPFFLKIFSNREEIKQKFDLNLGPRMKIEYITLDWLKYLKSYLLGLQSINLNWHSGKLKSDVNKKN